MGANERQSISIVIDDRERASGLAEALSRITACQVKVRRLAAGDIAIGEGILVERKEAADFVASLMDGRLGRQVDALERTGKQAILLLEGEFSAHNLAGMAPQAVRQAILALQIDRRLPLIRARDTEDSARWLAALAEKAVLGLNPLASVFDPAAQATAAHPAGHRAPRRPMANQPQGVALAALARIPGIGPAKAQALLKHFGSMQALLAAGEPEWAAAPGIGPAGARAIREHFPSFKGD